MQIKKCRNEYGSNDIELECENKILSYKATGSDFTIFCRYKNYQPFCNIDFTIPIDEDLYPLFLELYETLFKGQIMGQDLTYSHVYKNIIKDDGITILCDAHPVTFPNILRIKKTCQGIELLFEKIEGLERKNPFSVSINVRQSGSRLYEFAYPFKVLFNSLQLVEEPKKLIIQSRSNM